MLFAACLIRLTGGGPVFLLQKRTGLEGRPFYIWKLRTMGVERSQANHDTPFQQTAGPDDPRVTSTGRWLRRMSLDEVPQLISVIRREMSLVGPRPHAPELYDVLKDMRPDYTNRLPVRPSIT
ncbi:MAG: sugar transferase [Pseudomonadota bacterium]